MGLTQGIMTLYHWMLLNARNKNIYGLGVGISTVFKIFSYFPFKGAGLTPGVMTYIPLDAPQHKEQEYIWFRGRDLNGFQDIQLFPIPGGWG